MTGQIQRPFSARASRLLRGAVLGLLLALCGATLTLAQGTATLRGRITDKEGQPLPGTVVSLKSARNPAAASLGGLCDPRGEFRIPNLPPGDDYQVAASFPGMTTVIQGPVRLEADKLTTVDFVLVQELVTTIRVEAKGDVVDTTTATARTTVNEAFLASLPILGRNYTDLLTLAPGVTDTDGDGKPNVHGAREVDLQTRLDGVNITDPFGGEDAGQVNIEAIEEIQLIVAGANAEYGRAQGGVVNVTTKSGGNEFEGSFKVFYQTRSLDGDGAHNQDVVAIETDKPSFRTLKPFLTVGGALKRDRVWYFLANQYIDQQEPINALGVTRNQTIEGWSEFGKLTWQINPSHKAVLEILYDPRTTTGNNIGVSISPRSDYELKRATPVFTARETWVASSALLLESTLSYLDGRQRVRPVVETSDTPIPCPDLLRTDPVRYDLTCAVIPTDSYTQKLDTGQIAGPWWVSQDSDASRLTARQDLSFYVDDFLGSHQFKAGFELASEDYNTTVEQRPLRYEFEPGRARSRAFLWSDFEARVQQAEASAEAWSFYVQDTWRILPNLTLNVGLRLDREDLQAPGQTPFDPAAERAEFNRLAALAYSNFDPDPSRWEAEQGAYNPLVNPETENLYCDIGGPQGFPDSVCDSWDDVALTRVFTRHEAERSPAIFFKQTEGEVQFFVPPCGHPRRQGTCRDEEEIDLSNTNLAPRVSLSYDPFGDGKTKLYATYGRFYDRLFLATIIPEQARDFTYVSLNGTGDPIAFSSPVPRNFQVYQVSRELRTPFTDELTFGLERELTPELSISLRYITRKGRDQIQTRDINHFTQDTDGDGFPDDRKTASDPDQTFEVPDTFPDLYAFNPFFGGVYLLDNFNTSDYRGLELNLVRRLHRNWQFDASYTYSETVGNAEAFEDFFLGGDTSQVENEFGHLSFDQTHVFKFNAVAHLPKRFMLGGRITWESGLPYSLLRRELTFDLGRNPLFRQIFPTGQRNDQRNAGRWLLDLNLRKDFDIGGNSAGVEFTITNLLNSDDLEISGINDRFQVFQLVEGSERRFGRRFQVGFVANF